MERAGRAGSLPDAGFGGAHLDLLGRRPGGQPGEARDPQGRDGALPALRGALSVKVKVLFFAGLREQLGTAGEEIELPGGVATVAGLRSYLSNRGNSWKTALAEGKLGG